MSLATSFPFSVWLSQSMCLLSRFLSILSPSVSVSYSLPIFLSRCLCRSLSLSLLLSPILSLAQSRNLGTGTWASRGSCNRRTQGEQPGLVYLKGNDRFTFRGETGAHMLSSALCLTRSIGPFGELGCQPPAPAHSPHHRAAALLSRLGQT